MSELVYPPVIAAAKVMFRVLDLRFGMAGTEHVPRVGGAVLASNHVSYLDFIFAGFAAQPSRRLVRFMAKDSVFKHRVSGPLMRGMHHIPVDRSAGAASYAEALRALRAGEVVGVFPEATISRSWRLKEFKSGAARMAMATGTPLVPVVLWGGQRLMTKAHPRDLRTRGRTITIRVGEPLNPQRRDDADAVTSELKRRMAALLDDAIAAHPDRPDGPDDRWWLPRDVGGTAPTPEEAAAIEAAERSERGR
ncbi:MAG TPA: lysophospholipid acyltransferase family protein [Jiangellales bacterium]|nr:lysophospholipid acyltransferase family protein [Jiangellales bacterium]